MLNELSQVANALKRRKIPLKRRSDVLDPMTKNAPTLVIKLGPDGALAGLEVVAGETAGEWLRVKHGSEGAAFPGFNLPAPLCELVDSTSRKEVEKHIDPRARRYVAPKDAARIAWELLGKAKVRQFTAPEKQQFLRSVRELVGWLESDLQESGPDLVNLRTLLAVTRKANLDLPQLASRLTDFLKTDGAGQDLSLDDWALLLRLLFEEKTGKRKTWTQPIFLDLADGDPNHVPVADRRTAELLNRYLLANPPRAYKKEARGPARVAKAKTGVRLESGGIQCRDAYSGERCNIPDTFPKPKIAVLGNVCLFSNNTQEAECLSRYGLGGSATFKVSTTNASLFSDALLTIAGEERRNITCRSIPGNKSKRELLCVYLEDEPDASDPFVELFGGQSETAAEADFAAVAKPVLDALDARIHANPNQLLRLFCICSLDKANKQVSLSRSYTVREVMTAAKAWQDGAANAPPVTMPFFDKETKKSMWKSRTVPSPLETAIVLNRVWASGDEGGFRSNFERALSIADAYDIFIAPDAIRNAKVRSALQVILLRMRALFTRAAILKVAYDWRELDALQKRKPLHERARWQVLKTVALIGIFLRHLGHQHEVFMKEPIYQVGRLLALADSLHFQYCKWVRTSAEKRKAGRVDAPSELLGNALFGGALENPLIALARLAGRIHPYKGWADTYSGEDAGLVHWFVRQMAECERQIDPNTLPKRMEDVHKAQLMLGYLADNPKSEKKETETT